ncbi:MAG: hypothetical protein AAF810_02480 [Cyanobacteria bacterium P01_D01_bin.36]
MSKNLPNNITDNETVSTNILGPVVFTLSDLEVQGSGASVPVGSTIAPGDSPFIVASNETFTLSVNVEFNNSPLTKLLLCLVTQMKIRFSLEGVGQIANEVDLDVTGVTQKGQYTYELSLETTAEEANMTAGLYAITAVASIGPSENPCANDVYGFGYIAGRLLQVYDA